MPTVLDRIVANKREEIAFAKARRDLQSLIEGARYGPEVRDFLHALQGQGEMAVRELARRVGRDVKRVHEDVVTLCELGLVERAATGAVLCPFAEVHIDMRLFAAQPAAA